MANILTYIELQGNEATPSSLQALNQGRDVATELGATLYALLPCASTPTYDDEDIIVGDTRFAGSVGRTDFPLSNPSDMRRSLERLFALPSHLRVHSGHGPVTTLAAELETNPFVSFLRARKGARQP